MSVNAIFMQNIAKSLTYHLKSLAKTNDFNYAITANNH